MVKDILKDLVAFNTVADKENKEIMDYCDEFFRKLDFRIERFMNTDTEKEILIATYGDGEALGFSGHTDVINVAEGWLTDPFGLTDKGDGYLYGLGACDMKGGIAAFMEAIARTDLKKLKKGITVYLSYDEEVLFNGIYDIMKLNRPLPSHVVVAEPTDMVPAIGSKGLIEVYMDFHGVTTHSSIPTEGKNSNKNACGFINRMMAFEENVLKKDKYPLYEVPYTTMNVGVVQGGTCTNKIPDYTRVGLDFRVCDYKKEYDLIVNKLKEETEGIDVGYEITCDVPSLFSDGELADFCIKWTEKEGTPFAGATEGSFMDTDVIIIGPGPMCAHEKNERVSIQQLDDCTRMFRDMIQHFCG